MVQGTKTIPLDERRDDDDINRTTRVWSFIRHNRGQFVIVP